MTRNTLSTWTLALFALFTLSLTPAIADIHYTAHYMPPQEHEVALEDGAQVGNPEITGTTGHWRIIFEDATTGEEQDALDSWTADSFTIGLGFDGELVTNHTFEGRVLTIPVPYPNLMEDGPDHFNPSEPHIIDTRPHHLQLASAGDLVLAIEGYGELIQTTLTEGAENGENPEDPENPENLENDADAIGTTVVVGGTPTMKFSIGPDGHSVEADMDGDQRRAAYPRGSITPISPKAPFAPALQQQAGTMAVTWGSLKARK